MKTTTIKWVLGIALLSIQTVAYSQNFINETKQWAILSTYSVKNEYLYSYWTTYYKFSGDSIINGFSYHKLYKSTDSSQVNWTLSYSPLWWERNDSVFIREGGCSGLVLNDTTMLVYDFNLEEGDTFKIGDWNMKVDSIRYIEWGGIIRKFWFFNQYGSYPYNCLTWIEGVGHFGNFNYPGYCINSLAESLLCFSENGNLVYQDPYYTNCYVYTTVPSITKSQELINLFPNPATNYLTLNIDNVHLSPFTFQLYDMQGRLQLTGRTGNSETEINVATFRRGLYVLKVITNQQIVTKKIVLQ